MSVLDLGCGVGRLANVLAEGGSSFGVVVLASHLVNVGDPVLRRAFLGAAARHVAAEGLVLVQHWEVPSEQLPADVDTAVGPVRIQFRVLDWDGNDFEGRVVYTLGGRSWSQTCRARLLDDIGLDRALGEVGLERRKRLSAKWLAASRQHRSP